MAIWLRTVLAAIVVIGPAVAAFGQGVSITSISPSHARHGESVTVGGGGFGGPNVRVQVGGMTAEILHGMGNQVTFRVPAGVPVGPTTVTITNPGSRTATVAFTVVLAYTLDEARAVHDTIGPEGGVLRTQSAGTTFTLTVPPFALSSEEMITLTPVATAPGLPLRNGFVGAAHFAPDGLRFRFPARLTIEMGDGPAPGPILGFISNDDGTAFHPYPSHTSATTLEFLVFHFSLVGGGMPSPADISAQRVSISGSPADIALSEIALLATERAMGMIDAAAEEAGQVAALRRWFDVAVRPAMTAASTNDDAYFESGAVEELIAWNYYAEIFVGQALVPPFSGLLAAEASIGYGLLLAGAQNGIARSNQRCLAEHNVSPYVQREILVWYMNEIGLFSDADGEQFRTENLSANLCVRPRITGIDVPGILAEGSATGITVHAGAFFLDDTPVPAADNTIELVLDAAGATLGTYFGMLVGPGDFSTTVTPQPDATSVVIFARARWLTIFEGDTAEAPACVDPALATPTGCAWPIVITPANVTIAPGAPQSYIATVNGVARPVLWAASGGGIVGTGLNTATYTAGALAGVFSVTATSADHPTQSLTVPVTIAAPPSPPPQPPPPFICGACTYQGTLLLPVYDNDGNVVGQAPFPVTVTISPTVDLNPAMRRLTFGILAVPSCSGGEFLISSTSGGFAGTSLSRPFFADCFPPSVILGSASASSLQFSISNEFGVAATFSGTR